jgi:hypothetical protein
MLSLSESIYRTDYRTTYSNKSLTFLRDRLQACPKIKEGEFDIDILCKNLQMKAKSSETGAIVSESDFNEIMKLYII